MITRGFQINLEVGKEKISQIKMRMKKQKIVPLDYKFLEDTLEIRIKDKVDFLEHPFITLTAEQYNKINRNTKIIIDYSNYTAVLSCWAESPSIILFASLLDGSTLVAIPIQKGLTENYTFPFAKYETELSSNLSDYNNDAKYITNTVADLINYYTKNDVDNLINAIHTLDIQIVTELPTENISHTTIYLKGTETSGTNDYEEWIYTVNNSWELIGSTAVDLTGYLKTKDADKGYLQKKTGSEMAALADINTADINNNGMIVLCTEQGATKYQQGHIYILTIYAEQGAIETIGWRDITSTYYELPTASAETLGGVKVGKTEGSGIKIDENGEISVDPTEYLSMKTVIAMFSWREAAIGDGINTAFTFTTESGSIADFYICDSKTGEEVYPNVKKSNYNETITITFTKPPKENEYTLYYYIGIGQVR